VETVKKRKPIKLVKNLDRYYHGDFVKYRILCAVGEPSEEYDLYIQTAELLLVARAFKLHKIKKIISRYEKLIKEKFHSSLKWIDGVEIVKSLSSQEVHWIYN
jgi:hypothetical protein